MNAETLKDLLANATPGPWFIGAQNDSIYIIDGEPTPGPYDGPIPKSEGPSVVATPEWRGMPMESNARLIALAPQLAAEVIKLRAALQEIATDMRLGDSLHAVCNHHIQVARAALRETQEKYQ